MKTIRNVILASMAIIGLIANNIVLTIISVMCFGILIYYLINTKRAMVVLCSLLLFACLILIKMVLNA